MTAQELIVGRGSAAPTLTCKRSQIRVLSCPLRKPLPYNNLRQWLVSFLCGDKIFLGSVLTPSPRRRRVLPRKPRFPKFCVRSSDGQAYIKVNGRKHYLGKHDSEKAQRRYSAICQRIASGISDLALAVQLGDDATVSLLVRDYLKHAKDYYSGSSEYLCMVQALTPLVEMYGDSPADQFGPRDLAAIRSRFAESRVRTSANHNLSRVKKFWRWCCENELCDPGIYHRLTSVRGLRMGEAGCKESSTVAPVGMGHIVRLLPYVSPTVGSMLQVQYLCGMRPQDICQLRASDIDQSKEVWMYCPGHHKNRWRGQMLIKAIPPRAQAILEPYLANEPYFFRPVDAYRWRHEQLSDKPIEISRKFAERYNANSYRHAVTHGFDKAERAGVVLERWTPNQLRHGILSEVSHLIGNRAAKEWAGHKNEATTLRYTSADQQRLIETLTAIAGQLEQAWEISK